MAWRILPKRGGSKYHAKKCVVDGVKFDSIHEANRWTELRIMEKAGEIYDLQRQVKFGLIPVQKDNVGHVLERAISYVADFVYRDRHDELIVEDAKGVRTPEYKIKRKMMLWFHGIRIKEV